MAPLSGAEKESACVYFPVTFVLFWARFSTLGTIGANKFSRDQKKTKRDLFFFSGKGSLLGGLKSSPAPSKREQSTSLIRI